MCTLKLLNLKTQINTLKAALTKFIIIRIKQHLGCPFPAERHVRGGHWPQVYYHPYVQGPGPSGHISERPSRYVQQHR